MDAKTDSLNRLRLHTTGDEEIKCPSCNVILKRYEVAQHLEQEVENLRQIQVKAIAETEQAESTENGGSTASEPRNPRCVFQKVQRNRQSRLKRTRKRTIPPIEHPCPVCNANFPQDEIQRHAEQCLRRSNGTTNGRSTSGGGENSSNDEDDGEEYEEYEWAGQKRIRVSSLLQGGYSSIGIGQTITNHNGDHDDDDEDLNVDEDDTQIYGPQQYDESDIIPSAMEQNGGDEDSDVTSYMRRLITGNGDAANTIKSTNERSGSERSEAIAKKTEQTDVTNIPEAVMSTHSSTVIASTSKPSKLSLQHYQQIIDSLKAKLRYYENHVQSKFKCLICLDDYRNPAISVACWHVHCEECWLRSLGARKLCPQCNLITTAKDLRRIYM